MVDLNEIAIFLRVVEAGSFTAAAKLLRLPKTTVSRRVAHLEETLATRLLHRTTRSLSLTEAGRRYHAKCSGALAAVEAANRDLSDTRDIPSGVIRVSAPADTTDHFLPDLVADFLAANERIKVELLLTDERIDLIRERIDLSFRMGQLDDSSLVARKLGSGGRVLCASPAYLEANGSPRAPRDLKDHACIVHGASVEGVRWSLRGPKGRAVVPIGSRLAANSMTFAVKAAVAGLGIAMVPAPMIAAEVGAGRLSIVLPDWQPPASGIYIVYPSRRHLSPATRAFIAFAAERVAAARG